MQADAWRAKKNRQLCSIRIIIIVTIKKSSRITINIRAMVLGVENSVTGNDEQDERSQDSPVPKRRKKKKLSSSDDGKWVQLHSVPLCSSNDSGTEQRETSILYKQFISNHFWPVDTLNPRDNAAAQFRIHRSIEGSENEF